MCRGRLRWCRAKRQYNTRRRMPLDGRWRRCHARRQSATPSVARSADGNLRGRMANLRRSAVNLRNVAANLRSRGVNMRSRSANLRRGLLKNPWKRVARRMVRCPRTLQSSRFAIRRLWSCGGSSGRGCAGCALDCASSARDCAGYACDCAGCGWNCAGCARDCAGSPGRCVPGACTRVDLTFCARCNGPAPSRCFHVWIHIPPRGFYAWILIPSGNAPYAWICIPSRNTLYVCVRIPPICVVTLWNQCRK